MSRIGNAYRNLVTDDQMAFTHEQIHIGRIGEDIRAFVVDYKQSCKHLQAFPKMWRPASADTLGRRAGKMPPNETPEDYLPQETSSLIEVECLEYCAI